MPKTWKRLSTGIYRDQYSIRAIVNVAAGRKEKRFDFDMPLKDIKRWRNETKVKLEAKHPQRRAGMMGRGTFVADRKLHVKTLAISSWKSRRSELRAWEKVSIGKGTLGRMKRRRVTSEHIKIGIKAWVDAGVPAKTIQNRVRALTAFYHERDGADAWTPVDGVSYPRPRRRIPDYVAAERIIIVEQNLRALEDVGELAPEWRGRFMVINACGARPVHVKLALPQHIDLDRKVWNIIGAKGGKAIAFPLNGDQVAAWKVFIDANAWGDWDDTEYAKIVRAAGWPVGVRPYNAKHAFGQDLADLGIDRETIADLYGHEDTATTRIYVPTSKLKRATDAIDGRLGWGEKTADRTAINVGGNGEKPSNAQVQQALEVLRRAAGFGS